MRAHPLFSSLSPAEAKEFKRACIPAPEINSFLWCDNLFTWVRILLYKITYFVFVYPSFTSSSMTLGLKSPWMMISPSLAEQIMQLSNCQSDIPF